jgi:hypothetical protein
MVIDTLVGIPSLQESASEAAASAPDGERNAVLEEEMDDDFNSNAEGGTDSLDR